MNKRKRKKEEKQLYNSYTIFNLRKKSFYFLRITIAITAAITIITTIIKIGTKSGEDDVVEADGTVTDWLVDVVVELVEDCEVMPVVEVIVVIECEVVVVG